jgi:hypothetical protein
MSSDGVGSLHCATLWHARALSITVSTQVHSIHIEIGSIYDSYLLGMVSKDTKNMNMKILN